MCLLNDGSNAAQQAFAQHFDAQFSPTGSETLDRFALVHHFVRCEASD